MPLSILFLLSGMVFGQTTDLSTGNGMEVDSNRIFRTMRDALASPEHVYRLDLSRKHLDSLPLEIFQFMNLRELNLSKNKIQQLSSDISKLSKLERLDLSNNKLKTLPNEIGSLKSLIYLGLNRNVIDSLPPGIGGLVNLEVFELWDNELSDVPDEISELKKLKVLELRGILFSDEQQARIDQLVVRSAKVFMSPSCNCKY